jgi:hypothetical protein
MGDEQWRHVDNEGGGSGLFVSARVVVLVVQGNVGWRGPSYCLEGSSEESVWEGYDGLL